VFFTHGFKCADSAFVSCASRFDALPYPGFLLGKLFIELCMMFSFNFQRLLL